MVTTSQGGSPTRLQRLALRRRERRRDSLWNALTLDRLPLLALAGLLVVGLLGSEAYLHSGIVIEDSPFRPVWVSYNREEAVTLVGAILAALALAAIAPLATPVSMGWLIDRARRAGDRGQALWLVIAIGGVALAIYAKGEFLLYAPAYLSFAAPAPIVSLSSLGAPVVLIAAGVVSVKRPVLGIGLGVVMAAVLFASATRLFAGSMVLFLVGRLLAGSVVPFLVWLIAGVSAALTLPIPLMLRALSHHGLIPYAEATGRYMGDPGYLQSVIIGIAENIGFTVPLLVHVAGQQGITAEDMFISMNPAPATIAGWDRIVASMRVHYYIPYSMLGEFGSFGVLVLMVAVFVWACALRLCIQLVADPESRISLLFLAGQLGLGLISILYVTQYNTRNVSRVLSMMAAVVILFFIAREVVRRVWPTPPADGPPPETATSAEDPAAPGVLERT